MDQFIEENLVKGFIRSSKSPQTSPIFFISKKDRGKQMVMDYRYLNQGTVKNNYPLPLISQLIDRVKGCNLFMKMDLRWGYNNVWIWVGDKWKRAFMTTQGSFEPTVMFFGMCNSPRTSQQMMNDIFTDMLISFLVIFMDDLLISTKNLTMAEHLDKA